MRRPELGEAAQDPGDIRHSAHSKRNARTAPPDADRHASPRVHHGERACIAMVIANAEHALTGSPVHHLADCRGLARRKRAPLRHAPAGDCTKA